MSSGSEITQLLGAWSDGDLDARDRLIPLVYGELRRLAAGHLRRERQGHTLQPTALVHEAFLRLMGQDRTNWQSRRQFFSIASHVMRRFLVDRARARHAGKRSGLWSRVTLAGLPASSQPDVSVIDLDRALTRLAEIDDRKSRIAELRFFAGLSLQETADAVGVSRATAERDWQVARAWLFRELRSER